MSLSNTAVPKYYGRFREAVLRGDIPVCHEIEMEMNRIDSLIANPGIYYDDTAVEGFIYFCETELTLTDGSDLKLLDTFKLWAEQIFGWYYYVTRSVYMPYKDKPGGRYVRKKIKKRLINKQFLIIARGAAKSMYMSCIQNYFLNINRHSTHQIVVAPTMRQADETMAPIRTAITRSRGPIFQMMTAGSINNTTGSKANRPILASTKKGIENMLTGSIIEIRPMNIDKLQGLRIKVATVDEWLSCDIRENVITTIEEGCTKEQSGPDSDNDYIILAVSSEGTYRNGAGDDIKMELMDILKGKYESIHTSIWYYKLDDIKEIARPDMWIKAQPNIGKTVSYEVYQDAVTTAENVPSKRNDIIAKRFGIPLEGYTYFFTYDETLPTRRKQEFWKLPCSMGIDLSRGDDFTAFTFLFPLSDGTFGVKTRCYISSCTLDALPNATRMKYQHFINEGSLQILDCKYLDLQEVYDDLDQHIQDMQYDVRCVGYDPYNAKTFIERWATENGPHGIEKVIQGAKTESVPLGEIKTLAHERMLLFDEELMSYTMGNCIVLEDTNGNRKLKKERRENKIDSVSALMDAWVAYKNNKEDF
jgi:phage terminase large subunit-like protein